MRGDIVVLRAGDRVAADVRLLSARGLRLDQSVLSGEFLPVPKDAPGYAAFGRRPPETQEISDLPTLCFAGTAVVAGTGTAVVVGTGRRTYLGALADAAARTRRSSGVEQGVRRLAWTLIRYMAALVPVALLVNGSVRGDWSQAALFAIAVAVGLAPEMLPVIATATLARSAVQMSHRVVVRRLDAIQELGGMDLVCMDGTCMVTEGRVVFTHSADPTGRADDTPARYACLLAHLRSAADRFDEAVRRHVPAAEALLDEALHSPIDEIPFDDERRRCTVLVRDARRRRLVVSRGAPDAVLACCERLRTCGRDTELTRALRRAADEVVAGLQQRGLQVAAVAIKEQAGPSDAGSPDETGMTLLGFVGFVDPVKESAPAAVSALTERGVDVRVLSGDGPLVVARVCREAGIDIERVVEGAEVEAADDATLAGLVGDARAFAKVNPAHKARIVAALRAAGHRVGFLGDSADDGLAMRVADVGVAVRTATPAARAGADLVLLEPDLGALADGVLAGRRALGMTLRYVRTTSASNLGNALSVVAASVLLPFLPMLPLQLMVQNLLYDFAQLALPWDHVDPDYLRGPRRWEAGGLARYMAVFGALSSVFDLCTFAGLLWIFGLSTTAGEGMFRGAWFIEGLLSQLLVVLVLRGRRPGWPPAGVVLANGAALLAGLLIPLSALAAPLQMTPPPPLAGMFVLAVVATYLVAAVLLKRAFIRRSPWP